MSINTIMQVCDLINKSNLDVRNDFLVEFFDDYLVISCMNHCAIINTLYIKEVLLAIPFNLKFKLDGNERPLFLKYSFLDFEVYAAIAPSLPESQDMFLKMVI